MRGILILIGIGFLALTLAYILDVTSKGAQFDDQTRSDHVVGMPIPEPEKINTTPLPQAPPDGRPDRVVGKDLIAVPDIEPSGLERLPPREALSQPPDRYGAMETGTRLLHRPVATAAGLFHAQEYRIRIAGIDPVPLETTCRGGSEGASPCGRRALTAFRAWLRGRSIECDLTKPLADGVIEAPCRLGGRDAAAWLVEQGWARAKAGSGYSELETMAREKARGIYSKSE